MILALRLTDGSIGLISTLKEDFIIYENSQLDRSRGVHLKMSFDSLHAIHLDLDCVGKKLARRSGNDSSEDLRCTVVNGTTVS